MKNTESVVTAFEAALASRDPAGETLAKALGDSRLNLSETEQVVYDVVRDLNGAYFPPITSLELFLTEVCNLACVYCFERGTRGSRTMTASVGLAAIKLLFDYSGGVNTLRITFFGGEPTLNFALIQRLTEATEAEAARNGKTVAFSMTSNGVGLTRGMALYLRRRGLKVLLSLDGLEATHDACRIDRRGQGTFRRVVETLNLLKETQGYLGTRVTVAPAAAGSLYDNIVGLHDLGIQHFVIGHAIGLPWPEETIASYSSQLARLRAWLLERDDRGPTFSQQSALPPSSPGWLGCSAGRSSVAVSPAGDISPCSMMMTLNSTKAVFKLGSVKYGITHMRNRAELLNPSRLDSACSAAGIRDSYRGGCFGANYQEHGDVFKPSLLAGCGKTPETGYDQGVLSV
jgi:uncharacterized protein